MSHERPPTLRGGPALRAGTMWSHCTPSTSPLQGLDRPTSLQTYRPTPPAARRPSAPPATVIAQPAGPFCTRASEITGLYCRLPRGEKRPDWNASGHKKLIRFMPVNFGTVREFHLASRRRDTTVRCLAISERGKTGKIQGRLNSQSREGRTAICSIMMINLEWWC